MADIHMRVLVAIPLVADTKQRRNVSRETKKEKERLEKPQRTNTMCARLKSVYILLLLLFFRFFSSMCVLRSSDKQFS